MSENDLLYNYFDLNVYAFESCFREDCILIKFCILTLTSFLAFLIVWDMVDRIQGPSWLY